VLGVYARVLLAFSGRTAHAHGIPDGQTGTVTVLQRFGSGLPLHVHVNTLVLDGEAAESCRISRALSVPVSLRLSIA